MAYNEWEGMHFLTVRDLKMFILTMLPLGAISHTVTNTVPASGLQIRSTTPKTCTSKAKNPQPLPYQKGRSLSLLMPFMDSRGWRVCLFREPSKTSAYLPLMGVQTSNMWIFLILKLGITLFLATHIQTRYITLIYCASVERQLRI